MGPDGPSWQRPPSRPEARGDAFADIFIPAPRWGLRGDPVIWWTLREALSGTSIPDTVEAIAATIDAHFDALAAFGVVRGDKLDLPQIRDLAPGVSGGVVSLTWWVETGRPTLIARASGVAGLAAEGP